MAASRLKVLLPLLGLSAGLVAWDGLHGKEPPIAAAVTRKASAHGHAAAGPSGTSPATAVALVRERAPVDESDSDDAFAPLQPPPPPAPASAAPAVAAPPAPPELPFTVIGKQLEQGRWAVFLTAADEPLVAHQGDILAEHYRVERIDPPTMTLTYLPLHQTQTLQIGAAFND